LKITILYHLSHVNITAFLLPVHAFIVYTNIFNCALIIFF
jgi:hypothetical protein